MNLARWWSTIAWGTAPEWVAAAATVGALFVAYLVFTGDRRRSRRAEADRFISRARWSRRRHEQQDSWEYDIRVFNAGDTPIIEPVIIEKRPGNRSIRFVSDGDREVAPGAEETVLLRPVRDPREVCIYINFTDSHGRNWTRDVDLNRYVSERQITNRKWLRYRGSLPNRLRLLRENRRKSMRS